MKTYYESFKALLQEEKKEEAVLYALDLIKKEEVDVIDLYTQILTPALNNMESKGPEDSVGVWEEHIRTAIVRTIVECCYPYVIEKRNQRNIKNKGRAIVLCPPEEYHDLGARMCADFFTINGYSSTFVGSNTPDWDFYKAIEIVQPDWVAISVSNYYNLAATKRIIEKIKSINPHKFKIIVGGYAFNRNPEYYKVVGADYYACTYQDIENIVQSEVTK